MCWASPSDASKSCQAALLAARKESSRLKSAHSSTAESQSSANELNVASSKEAERLKQLVSSLRASRDKYSIFTGTSSGSRSQINTGHPTLDVRSATASTYSTVPEVANRAHTPSESESSWQDAHAEQPSPSSSDLLGSGRSHSSESHCGNSLSGSAEDANAAASKKRRSGRARQRTSKYWKSVRQRTPSPGVASNDGFSLV